MRLPARKAIDEIQYEQFLLLTATLGDASGPVVINFSREVAASSASPNLPQAQPLQFGHGVPLQALVEGREPEIEHDDSGAGGEAQDRAEASMAHLYSESDETNQQNPASFKLALHMPFRQTWAIRGYSKGRLINAIALGPMEEQTIEIFSWDRSTAEVQSSFAFESDATSSTTASQKDSRIVARNVGDQTGFNFTTNGKVGFNVGLVNGDFSAGGGAEASFNSSEQTTITAIAEATHSASNHVKSSRTLSVTETREHGREERVTRRIRNSNPCHTTTIAFFEILTHYKVTTMLETEGVQLVALVPARAFNVPNLFDRNSLRYNEKALNAALLSRELAAGFEAARLLYGYDRACSVLCTACRCGPDIPAAKDKTEWPRMAAALQALGHASRGLDAPTTFPVSVDGGVFIPLPGGALGNDALACADIRRYLAKSYARSALSSVINRLKALPDDVRQVMPADADAINSVLAGLPAEVLEKMTFDRGTKDGVYTQAFEYLMSPLSPFAFKDPVIAVPTALALVQKNVNFDIFNDEGLSAAIRSFNAAYSSWQEFLNKGLNETERERELDRIENEERRRQLLQLYPPLDVTDAQERMDALLHHINDKKNVDYYRFAVWSERGTVFDLDLFGWARLGLIEPRPIGFVGDYLAVPVNVQKRPYAKEFVRSLVASLPASQRKIKRRVVLPSPAVYSDTYLGECDSCDATTRGERALELRGQELEVQAQQVDLERRRARLAARPPQLDPDPSPNALRIVLEKAD